MYQALDLRILVILSKQQQFYLLSGIQEYIKNSKIEFISVHIKVYQDDMKIVDTFNIYAIINIEMGLKAGIYWYKNVRTKGYTEYFVAKRT